MHVACKLHSPVRQVAPPRTRALAQGLQLK
jgi:hypothetical protein